jgi:hypothetical protein
MRASNVSLTRASTSPGEAEPKAWATALSMLAEAAEAVHREAHGNVADEIIEVKEGS